MANDPKTTNEDQVETTSEVAELERLLSETDPETGDDGDLEIDEDAE